MRHWGLRYRIIAAVMVPMLALGVTTLVLDARDRLAAIERHFNRSASHLAERWANLTRSAIEHRQPATLASVIEIIARDPEVAKVVVRNRRGEVIIARRGTAVRPWTSALGEWLTLAIAGRSIVPQPGAQKLLATNASLRDATVDPGGTIGHLEVMPSTAYMAEQFLTGSLPPLALLVGLLAPAYLAAALTADSVGTPLRRVTRHLARLGEDESGARLPALGGAELAQLETAVNAAAAAIMRHRDTLREQVRQTTEELENTLQAVEIRNVELDMARKRALEGARVKSEFLANVSHEIRTPINGVVGFVDLLQHTPLEPEQREYVDTIRESCDSLLGIVNDVLDLSKIEAGKLAIDHVVFDLRDCVEEVLSLLAPAAYGKGLELVKIVYADVPKTLYGDPVRVRQVMTNLVHNAVKFTARGRVVVRVMLAGDDARGRVRIAVSDTGSGLGDNERRRLFQRAEPSEPLPTRRFGGSGLGLVISRALVEQMAGEMGVDSDRGKGSTFWFTLPLHGSVSAGGTADPPTPLTERKVLLYDPDELAGLACAHMLEAWSITVTRVSQARAYEAHLAAGGWDLTAIGFARDALVDEATAALLRAAVATAIPVVAFVASVDRNEHRRYYQLGAAACLPKAVRRQTVYRELCRVLGLQQITAQPHASMPVTTTPTTPRRVLVVDDNAVNRKLVQTIARRAGAVVEEAEDGLAAVATCRSEHFDVVLMDLRMPELGGAEAAQRIRAEGAQPTPPRIIALTAEATERDRRALREQGFDDCLIKPVSEQQILAMLQAGSTPSTADADLRGELRAMLSRELPEHRGAIEAAAGNGNRDALHDAVHRLHGAVSVCGLVELKTACRHLESAASNGDDAACAVALEALRRELDAGTDSWFTPRE